MRHARRAFTLIELMLVVMVMALLLSLLMPAMEAVRNQAQKTACVGHLRQVMAVIIHDAEQTDGYLQGVSYFSPNSADPYRSLSDSRGPLRIPFPGGYNQLNVLTLKTPAVLPGGATRFPAGPTQWGYPRLRAQMEDPSIVYCPASFSNGGMRSHVRDLGGSTLVTPFVMQEDTDTPAEAQRDFLAEGGPDQSGEGFGAALNWGYAVHTWVAPTWADRYVVWTAFDSFRDLRYLGCKPWGLRNRYAYAPTAVNGQSRPVGVIDDPRAVTWRGICARLSGYGNGDGQDVTILANSLNATCYALSLGSTFVAAGRVDNSGGAEIKNVGVSTGVPTSEVAVLCDWTRPLAYRGFNNDFLFIDQALDATTDLNAAGNLTGRGGLVHTAYLWNWNHRDGGNVAFLDGRVAWFPLPADEATSTADLTAQRIRHALDRATVRWYVGAPYGMDFPGDEDAQRSYIGTGPVTGTTGSIRMDRGQPNAMPMNY